MAREAEAQRVWFGLGVHARRRLGSNSKPVYPLCSNLDPGGQPDGIGQPDFVLEKPAVEIVDAARRVRW